MLPQLAQVRATLEAVRDLVRLRHTDSPLFMIELNKRYAASRICKAVMGLVARRKAQHPCTALPPSVKARKNLAGVMENPGERIPPARLKLLADARLSASLKLVTAREKQRDDAARDAAAQKRAVAAATKAVTSVRKAKDDLIAAKAAVAAAAAVSNNSPALAAAQRFVACLDAKVATLTLRERCAVVARDFGTAALAGHRLASAAPPAAAPAPVWVLERQSADCVRYNHSLLAKWAAWDRKPADHAYTPDDALRAWLDVHGGHDARLDANHDALVAEQKLRIAGAANGFVDVTPHAAWDAVVAGLVGHGVPDLLDPSVQWRMNTTDAFRADMPRISKVAFSQLNARAMAVCQQRKTASAIATDVDFKSGCHVRIGNVFYAIGFVRQSMEHNALPALFVLVNGVFAPAEQWKMFGLRDSGDGCLGGCVRGVCARVGSVDD